MLRLLNGSTYHISPFSPGAVIVAYTWIAKQVGQSKPGMGRTLANTTVRDDIFIRCNIFAVIDLAQFLSRLKCTIGVSCCGPGNILRSWNMTTALRAFLRVIH